MPILPRFIKSETQTVQQRTRRPRPVIPQKLDTPGDAQIAAKELILEAKDQALAIKAEAEEEARKVRHEALELQAKLAQKEEQLAVKSQELAKLEKQLNEKLAEIEKVRSELIIKLEKISSITRTEAKEELLANLEKSLSQEFTR